MYKANLGLLPPIVAIQTDCRERWQLFTSVPRTYSAVSLCSLRLLSGMPSSSGSTVWLKAGAGGQTELFPWSSVLLSGGGDLKPQGPRTTSGYRLALSLPLSLTLSLSLSLSLSIYLSIKLTGWRSHMSKLESHDTSHFSFGFKSPDPPDVTHLGTCGKGGLGT
jgi:hypothetical protein